MMRAIQELDSFKDSLFFDYFKQQPIGFMDIGARGGAHSVVEPLHSFVSYLGFELDQAECDALNADETLKKHWNQFEVLPYALAKEAGLRTLNILSSPNNTSLLKLNEKFVQRYSMHPDKWTMVKECELTTTPLDHIMYDLQQGFKQSGEIIKIDTQGTELEILQGARKLLSDRTVCIVAEAEFFQLYKEQNVFSDMDQYLRTLGFSFYGFLTQHTRSRRALNKKTNLGKERLFYADVVFFKDPFANDIQLSQRQYYILLFSALLTGYYDFALEIAASKQLNLPPQELNYVKQVVNILSYVDPHETAEKLNKLVQQVNRNKESANVLLGKFIDSLGFPDFEDMVLPALQYVESVG